MDASSLITVEALAIKQDAGTEFQLHPVQKAMVECHGSQCGFCTPGFVIAITGLVEKKLCHGKVASKGNDSLKGSPANSPANKTSTADKITDCQAKNAMTGNLCRCTGYQPIIDAATSIDLKSVQTLSARYYSNAQDKDLHAIAKAPLHLKSSNSESNEIFELYAPTTLAQAAKYLAKNKTAKILAAATDLGVVHNKFKSRLTHVMSLHLLEELNQISFRKRSLKTGGIVSIGARATLTDVREALKDRVPEFARFLDLFASPQIKNVATLVGNVANASPIADTPPFLLVSGAVVHIAGAKNGALKKRKVPIEKFFLNYRKTAVKPGEIITAIEFELPQKKNCLKLYKVSERKDLDISTVNAAFNIDCDPGGSKSKAIVHSARIAVGGVAATTIRLYETEKFLKNTQLNTSNIEQAIQTMQSEIKPIIDVRGTSAYRRILLENLFRQFASQL